MQNTSTQKSCGTKMLLDQGYCMIYSCQILAKESEWCFGIHNFRCKIPNNFIRNARLWWKEIPSASHLYLFCTGTHMLNHLAFHRSLKKVKFYWSLITQISNCNKVKRETCPIFLKFFYGSSVINWKKITIYKVNPQNKNNSFMYVLSFRSPKLLMLSLACHKRCEHTCDEVTPNPGPEHIEARTKWQPFLQTMFYFFMKKTSILIALYKQCFWDIWLTTCQNWFT